MKEEYLKITFDKKQKMMIISIVAFICTLIGATYAWLTSDLLENGNRMRITSAALELTFRGTSQEIIADLSPGESVTKSFEITNYTDASISYNLYWKMVTNNFTDKNYFTYTLIDADTSEQLITSRYLPSDTSTILSNVSISGLTTQRYNLVINYVKDPLYNQVQNADQYFSGDISINKRDALTTLDISTIYLNGENINYIPSLSTYSVDSSRTYCTDGSSVSTANNTLTIENQTPSTTCELYFVTSNPDPLAELPYNLLIIDPNGANESTTQEKFLHKNESINLEPFQRSGYEFGGWEITGSETTLNNTKLTMGTTYSYAKAKWLPTLQTEILKETAYADNVNSPYVQNETPGINYRAISSTTNGQGLYYTSTNTESTCEVGDPTYVSPGVCKTYFYRGAVENNYVSFANELWRIVRINEDGSIRIITENPVSDRTTPTARATVAFNSASGTESKYLGYTYDESKMQVDSTIKDFIENPTTGWYGKISNYESYLADTGACNDRTYTYIPMLQATHYGATERINSGTPRFSCPEPATDLYTMNGKIKGNGLSRTPVGLLTADEYFYTGWHGDDSYLDSDYNWWTLSPSTIFSNLPGQPGQSSATLYSITNTGGFDNVNSTNSTTSVRPVVSLKADTIVLDGTGTSNDPYVITIPTLQELILKETAYADNVNSPYVENGTPGINYRVNSSATNGRGLYYTSTNTESTCEAGDATYVSPGVCKSYFYRGAVTNNYVSFANQLWRIIRINEDGSIRIMLNDKLPNNNAFQLQSVNILKQNMYMPDNEVVSGSAADALNTWYNTTLSTSEKSKVNTNAIYCNDMSIGEVNNLFTYFGAITRLQSNTPQFLCPQTNDKLVSTSSTLNASNVNKILVQPIGLITADEIMYAGESWNTDNTSFYLYRSYDYWSMSPGRVTDVYVYATALVVRLNYGLNENHNVTTLRGIVPVITLKSDVLANGSGTGTYDNPYVIIE